MIKAFIDFTSGSWMDGMESTLTIDYPQQMVTLPGQLLIQIEEPGGCRYLRKLMPSLMETMIELLEA